MTRNVSLGDEHVGAPLIRIRNFTYTYPGQERPALDDFSLDIAEGDFVLLTGASGCGKSTLAKAMCGFLEEDVVAGDGGAEGRGDGGVGRGGSGGGEGRERGEGGERGGDEGNGGGDGDSGGGGGEGRDGGGSGDDGGSGDGGDSGDDGGSGGGGGDGVASGESRGTYRFEGKDATGMEPRELAGRIAYVQQDPDSQIVSLSVEEELAFGLENLSTPRKEMKKRIRWALGTVRGGHLMGRDTLTLSGGEKQKVAIASMLALRPKLLILDEPTASLDPRSTKKALEAIRLVHKRTGMTVLVLEHRLDYFLPLANKVVVMHEGRDVWEGTPRDLLEDESWGEGMPESAKRGIRVPGKARLAVGRGRRRGERAIISAKHVCVKRGGKRVLRDIGFDIYPGEIVGLMGDNGSGKTSLALSMLNLLPYSGHIRYKGKAVHSRKTSSLAKKIGLVFQNPNHQIFEGKVIDEAAFASRNFSLEGAEEMARRELRHLGIGQLEDRSPHCLSHGQKRRLNIASVTSYGPSLYILDEPFIGQDLANTRAICERLEAKAKKGAAGLIITHDPLVASQFCNRLLFLERGRLVMDGDAEKVLHSLVSRGITEYSEAGV